VIKEDQDTFFPLTGCFRLCTPADGKTFSE